MNFSTSFQHHCSTICVTKPNRIHMWILNSTSCGPSINYFQVEWSEFHPLYCCVLGGRLDTGWAEVFVIFLDSDNFHPMWCVLLWRVSWPWGGWGPGSPAWETHQVLNEGLQLLLLPTDIVTFCAGVSVTCDCILFNSGWWECDTWHRVSQPGARMLHKNNFSKSWPGSRHSRKFSAFTWCHMIITIRSRVTL